MLVSWQTFPGMTPNDGFLEMVQQKIPDRNAPVLLLCRSGQRSRNAAIALTAAGYSECYNIADGFEGPKDESGHRSTVSGWRVSGLPWQQG